MLIEDRHKDSYKDDEKAKQNARRYILERLLTYNDGKVTIEHDVFGNEYKKLNYEAIYKSNEQQIFFNHNCVQDYRENIIHEFGHAIAYQYDLNKNEKIQEIYVNLKRYEVTINVSSYANKSIYEFIAEVFTQCSYFGKSNAIIQPVIDIIEDKIKKSKARTNDEIFNDKIREAIKQSIKKH